MLAWLSWVLVEEASRGSLSDRLLLVPDSGEDNDGLNDGVGLGDVVTLVERSSCAQGGKEQGSEDVGGLHFVCFLRYKPWCLGISVVSVDSLSGPQRV